MTTPELLHASTQLSNLLRNMVTFIAHRSEEVAVDAQMDGDRIRLRLRVSPHDLARVIGKQGATADALRIVIRAMATKLNLSVRVEIADTSAG